jgi:hypothetical protein
VNKTTGKLLALRLLCLEENGAERGEGGGGGTKGVGGWIDSSLVPYTKNIACVDCQDKCQCLMSACIAKKIVEPRKVRGRGRGRVGGG